jgi:hypothetical protein
VEEKAKNTVSLEAILPSASIRKGFGSVAGISVILIERVCFEKES